MENLKQFEAPSGGPEEAVFHEMGKEEITYHEDVEVSDPGPGEVKVRIHAAGVCHSDLSAMNGTLPQPAPAVLGHEGAGEVVAVGPGVENLKHGDRIAAMPAMGFLKKFRKDFEAYVRGERLRADARLAFED